MIEKLVGLLSGLFFPRVSDGLGSRLSSRRREAKGGSTGYSGTMAL